MNNKLAYIEGWISIIINIILFILKLLTGILTHSVAIIADAWHTLSDSITSLIVILGAFTSSKPGDEEHPFGHGRIELIASIIIGVILLIVGFNFLIESIQKLLNKEIFSFHPMIITVFTLSIILKEGIALFSFWASKKLKSVSLKADGWHHRSDAIASLLILIGILIGKYFWWIDGVLGILVAILIGYTAVSIIKESVNPLIGEKLDNNTIEKIENIVIKTINKNASPHHYHIHRYGNHKELTFHIYLDGKIEINKGHFIIDRIEKEIKKIFNIDATIHIDPLEDNRKNI